MQVMGATLVTTLRNGNENGRQSKFSDKNKHIFFFK